MAKRFMTTELFEDAWFMDLPAKYKLFWIYLLTRCSNSGIWQVNWKLAQFYVGDNLEPVEVKRIFADRVKEFEDGKYWFIPKFIQFQYGERLSRTNPATMKVIKALEDYKLFDFLPKTKISEGASKHLQSSLQGAQDKEEDKEEEEDKDKAKDKVNFNKEAKKYFLPLFKEYFPEESAMFFEVWCDWVNYRIETGKKLTPRSAKLQLKFLRGRNNRVNIINQSIQNQWQGLFEEKNNGTNKQQAIRGSVDIDKWQRELNTIKPRST